ncbi:MAG TPA: GNAT family N-acetyltransferase [Bacteroidia bacterium]|nr:GNAT family N-acetyltransferase [Bacteroidia bacterium]
MEPDRILIIPATAQDMPIIEKFAKKFDLDCENLHYEEFIKAQKAGEDQLIGFGRLRRYPNCTELATLGVLSNERKKGVGLAVVTKLVEIGPKEIFVTSVIPDFFKKVGFIQVKEYPTVLQKKINFCKCYGYREEEVFVMKLIK